MPLRCKRISIVMLMFFLCLTIYSCLAEPAVQTASGYRYILSDKGTAVIVGCTYDTASSLFIPDTLGGRKVTGIGDRAFKDCFYLESFEIPLFITEIGSNPFADCSRLKEIIVPDNHPVFEMTDGLLIDKAAGRIIVFCSEDPTETVTIPDGIRTIGDYAFYDCRSLNTIIIPEGVHEIGESAFESCTRLICPVLPSSLDFINKNAFKKCYRLGDELQIPGTVKTIGDYAFHLCNMTSLILSEGTEEICNNAFHGCNDMTDVYLPDSIQRIGDNPFAYCSRLKNIHLSGNHPLLVLDHNVLYDRKNHVLVCYPQILDDDSLEVPDGTKRIGSCAFMDCHIQSVILPDGLESIGEQAFFNSSLKEIVIPSSVTNIDNSFFWCYGLKATVTPGSYAEQYCIGNDISYNYPKE